MLRFSASRPVQPGDEVFAGTRKAGEVVNALGSDLLAVVSLEAVTVAPAELTSGDARLAPEPLPYEVE